MENPIKMDDLGVPLFLETPKWLINGGLLTTYVRPGSQSSKYQAYQVHGSFEIRRENQLRLLVYLFIPLFTRF